MVTKQTVVVGPARPVILSPMLQSDSDLEYDEMVDYLRLRSQKCKKKSDDILHHVRLVSGFNRTI